MSNKSEPFVEFKTKGQYGTSLRDPTPEELTASNLRRATLNLLRERVKTLKAEIKELEKECPHTVSQDTAGFPYDHRFCYACGISQGSV